MVASTIPDRDPALDLLKAALVALVIVHHVGQAYGPTGGLWYVMPEGERASILGLMFVLNRSFFMSLLFFVSGYFTLPSLARKGPRRYLADRLRRFGIPLLTFALVISPLLMYAAVVTQFVDEPIPFVDFYAGAYMGLGGRPADWPVPLFPLFNVGPLWFLEHLLLFTVVLVLWSWLRGRTPGARPEPSQPPVVATVLIFAVLLAAASVAVRHWYPIDRWVFLPIQVAPADVPRDVVFLVLGLLAWRRGWIAAFPARAGYGWLATAVVLAGAIALARANGWLVGSSAAPAVYALWESLFCCAMCIGLTVTFREAFRRSTGVGRWLAGNAFAAYVIHVPVVVALQFAAQGLEAGPLTVFAVVAAAAVVLTFVLSAGLRAIPGVRSVL